MGKHGRSKNTARKQSQNKVQDDTKFYIKYKDPRTKSQIFYYFDEEDIYDPCIPLNEGDIVYDSGKLAAVPTKDVAKPAQPVLQSQKKLAVKMNKASMQIQKSPLQAHSSEKIQVDSDEISAIKVESTISVDPKDLDDSFEDVGYMTAMDIKYIPDEPKANKTKEPLINLQVIEEAPQESNQGKQNFQYRTAMETVDKSNNILIAEALSKEVFEANTKANDIDPYQEWLDIHINKPTLKARLISPSEFRLLKRVIGLIKK